MTKILNVIKTKSFKIVAAYLALVLCVTGVVWHTATPVSAAELDITGTNVQGYSLLGSRGSISADNKLVGTSADSATMSVFVTGGSKDKYNANNVKWTHDGTSWEGDGTMLYEGIGSAQKIYACSPYTSDATNGVVTVNADDQIDWLVATSTDLTGSSVSLNMTHALAKLKLVVKSYGTEIEAGEQQITSVEVSGMYASGDLNIADNTWSNLGTADATLEMINNELLVIPMASCTEFVITVTMEDKREFTTTVSLAGVGNKLEAGTEYTIELQVGQNKVNIGGITADKWIPTEGGQLETY